MYYNTGTISCKSTPKKDFKCQRGKKSVVLLEVNPKPKHRQCSI